MPDYTVKADVDSMLRADNDAGIRSAIGLGQTDAPTFLAQTLTGQSLTGTQATSLVDLATTWLSTTGTPTAIKLNVTDTASNAASKLMDLQVGLVSVFSVSKTGLIQCNSAGASFPGGVFAGGSIGGGIGGSTVSLANNTGAVTVGSNGEFSFSTTTNASSGARDTILVRDGAAGILAQRNGTAAQAFRVYNTYDTAGANYDRLSFFHAGGQATIATEGFGTNAASSHLTLAAGGTTRSIFFQTAGSAKWLINSAGNFLAQTDNLYDIGASGANRPRNVYVGGYVIAASGGGGGYYIGAFGGISSITTGVFKWTNGAADGFDRFQLGGTTSAFPAIKRNGTGIDIVLANDSGPAPLSASNFVASGYFSTSGYCIVGSNNGYFWPAKGGMYAPSDGVIRLSNDSVSGFTRLELGTANLGISRGTGSPEGVVTALVGSLYLRTDGGAATTLYVKESSPTPSTGWVAK
jgi:hypothetical protein